MTELYGVLANRSGPEFDKIDGMFAVTKRACTDAVEG